MKGFVPCTDAFMVQRLRAAGAIILAKSDMAEWAFSTYLTISSIAGITRNPYSLDHVPAGSGWVSVDLRVHVLYVQCAPRRTDILSAKCSRKSRLQSIGTRRRNSRLK